MGEWTPAEKVQKCLNGTLAGKIALKLDANDGSKNQQISADIWNKFADEHGGKRINNSISAAHAMDSIMVYLLRESKKTGENVNDLAKKWLDGIGGENPTPVTPQKPDPKKQVPDPVNPAPVNPDPKVTPPKTDSNIPPLNDKSIITEFGNPLPCPRVRMPAEKIKIVPDKILQNMEIGKSMPYPIGSKGVLPVFGQLSRVDDRNWELKDEQGRVIQEYELNHQVCGYDIIENKYNDKGLVIESAGYGDEYSKDCADNYFYDDNDKLIGSVRFSTSYDGSFSQYYTRFDPDTGKEICTQTYENGKLKEVSKKLNDDPYQAIVMCYDDKGEISETREIDYTKDNPIWWSCRDKDGNLTKYRTSDGVWHNPDGSVRKEE